MRILVVVLAVSSAPTPGIGGDTVLRHLIAPFLGTALMVVILARLTSE